jgi:hypothetical protein
VVRIKKNVVYKYSKPETNANAVSSHEADRFEDVSNSADLSACGAPDNVKGEKKDTNRMAQLNADRSIDAVRFKEGAAAADLSASERPVYPFGDNVNKGKKSPSPVQQNADRSGDAARFSKKDAAWFEEHKWETTSGEPAKRKNRYHIVILPICSILIPGILTGELGEQVIFLNGHLNENQFIMKAI